MKRRQITLEDGRYLIFYTFEDEGAEALSSSEVKAEGSEEVQPKPVAEDERSV